MFIYFLVTWLAVVTSAVLLIALWRMEELSPVHGAVLLVLFVAGVYLQFFTATTVASLAGHALQTLLAVYLVIRWKMSE